jgi:hypothetical protein
MKGDLKLISNNIQDISEKKFNPKISESRVFERSTKLLRQSKDVILVNDMAKSQNLQKQQNPNPEVTAAGGSRIALSDFITMQEKKDEEKSSKVKNPFEWFEETIQVKLLENHKEDMSRFKIENNFFYDFFKNLEFISTEALYLVMTEINKMIDEYYNFLSEQVNEYASIFLQIFECYINIDIEDDKFKVLHDALILFFIKSLKNRSEEMIYIFKNILIKKIFDSMLNLENRDKLLFLCEIIYKIMDPLESQQVEFLKIFKDNLEKNEEVMYECFSIIHDLIPNYSEQLIDICLFYVLSGITNISVDIRYQSLYILHKYILMNINFFLNFEPKLKKLSLSENDRENNLLLIKMSLLFLKHNYLNKSKPKENVKKPFSGFEIRFDEDTANVNYMNELSPGNDIIKNILTRYMGDSLFMLIASSSIAEYLIDNIELNKIFLSALFQTNENILNYVFYNMELTNDIIKLQEYTRFRVKPEVIKYTDWHYHYLCQGINSIIEEREKIEDCLLSEKEYKFIEFTISPGFNPLHIEIWKNSFKFSRLIILDCANINRVERALKIIEGFLFFESIQKQILEDIYDDMNDLIIRLLEDKEKPDNKKCLEIISYSFRSWSQSQNSSSTLRDGLRKLIDLFVTSPIGKNPINQTNSINNNNQSQGNINPNMSGNINLNMSGNINLNMSGNINPNMSGNINPNMSGNINPNMSGNINPNMSGNINPNMSGNINPNMSGNINPNMSGGNFNGSRSFGNISKMSSSGQG